MQIRSTRPRHARRRAYAQTAKSSFTRSLSQPRRANVARAEAKVRRIRASCELRRELRACVPDLRLGHVLPAQHIFPGVGIAPWTLFNSSDLDSEGINQGSPVLEKEMIGLSVDWETTKTQR
jgi:hypothetical protein